VREDVALSPKLIIYSLGLDSAPAYEIEYHHADARVLAVAVAHSREELVTSRPLGRPGCRNRPLRRFSYQEMARRALLRAERASE
jgi:hypothetical protein